MRTWAKGSTPVALLAVGVMSLGSGTAFADTSGSGSIGGGNQLNLPISLPIDISGNAVAVAGDSSATSQGGASVVNGGRGNGGAGSNVTNGEHSILGGNQIVAPITAPINACGNAVAIFGDATAGCKGGASVKNSGSGAGGNRTSGRSSILGGNQVVAPITAPINLCGNSVAVLGEAFSGCKGGASVGGPGNGGGHGYRGHGHGHGHGRPGGAGGNVTNGEHSILGGNQIIAPITAPINACGNAVGNASAGCAGGTSVKNSGAGTGGNVTSGRSSILGGNQILAPITAPVNVCGNSVGVLGDAFSGCKGGASVSGGAGGGAGRNVTSGAHSILGGNQIVAPITAPINACGNAVAVLGDAKANCKGGASVSGGAGGGAGRNVTSGAHSILGGNQIVAPITAPINICGNAVAVLGDAAAGCLGGASVGGGQWHGRKTLHGTWNKGARKAVPVKTSGMLSTLPMVPGAADSGVLPTAALTPSRPAAGKGGAGAALAPVTGLVGSLPVANGLGGANALGGASDVLPLGDLGLMSAEQPVGVTGMNPGSLIALALGAMFAASATMFAVVRRFRLRGER
ncbi:chaplin family protein [Microtetraspora glauca]|uniref:Chaplin family protein n=1 Tax=Microtetraspora glauca TaxID=1996 RepID=A0ABV3GSK2_MICGL